MPWRAKPRKMAQNAGRLAMNSPCPLAGSRLSCERSDDGAVARADAGGAESMSLSVARLARRSPWYEYMRIKVWYVAVSACATSSLPIRKHPQDGIERRLGETRTRLRVRMSTQVEQHVSHAGEIPALRKEAQQRHVREDIRLETGTTTIRISCPSTTSRRRSGLQSCPSSSSSTVAAALVAAHLGQKRKRCTKVFFAQAAPAFLSRAIKEQIPLPCLDGATGVLERAEDTEDLCEATARSERAGRQRGVVRVGGGAGRALLAWLYRDCVRG